LVAKNLAAQGRGRDLALAGAVCDEVGTLEASLHDAGYLAVTGAQVEPVSRGEERRSIQGGGRGDVGDIQSHWLDIDGRATGPAHIPGETPENPVHGGDAGLDFLRSFLDQGSRIDGGGWAPAKDPLFIPGVVDANVVSAGDEDVAGTATVLLQHAKFIYRRARELLRIGILRRFLAVDLIDFRPSVVGLRVANDRFIVAADLREVKSFEHEGFILAIAVEIVAL